MLDHVEAKPLRSRFVIDWSEPDQCYVGSAPPLLGPCCQGPTRPAVFQQLEKLAAKADVQLLVQILIPDAAAAKRWMDAPREQFEGLTASEMIEKPGGADEVIGLLRGIGQGNFQ